MSDMTAGAPRPLGPLALAGFAPLQYAFNKTKSPQGQDMVILHIESVNGSFTFLWAPESLAEFGEACKAFAREVAAAGLTIATQIPDGLPPDFR